MNRNPPPEIQIGQFTKTCHMYLAVDDVCRSTMGFLLLWKYRLVIVSLFCIAWMCLFFLYPNSKKSVLKTSDVAGIQQIWLPSYFSESFSKLILKNTHLYLYNDTKKPSFFYGLMTDAGFNALTHHKSYSVVIFTGGDANIDRNGKTVKRIFDFLKLNPARSSSVAISKFIVETLKKHMVKHVERPFFPLDFAQFNPTPKGDSIFVYGLPHNVYHNDVVLKHIQPRFPRIKFFYAAHLGPGRNNNLPKPFQYYSRNELLKNIYPRCFLSIRLTHHDGLAGVVQELGLMGIKSVWNGGTPSAISWKNHSDIIDVIEREAMTVGKIDVETAEKVKHFLTIDKSFYHLQTYF